MINLITCTGDRQKSFHLLEYWIKQQTIQKFRWIVVDDGDDKTLMNMNQDYYRREAAKIEGYHTLMDQLSFLFSKISLTGPILFIEDDDYYAPEYVEIMSDLLKHYNIVGLYPCLYYDIIKPGYRFVHNTKMSSLAMTGISIDVWTKIYPYLNGNAYLDGRLWKSDFDKKFLFTCSKVLQVGIKNVPGRKGLTESQKKPEIFKRDRDFSMLNHWVGKQNLYLIREQLCKSLPSDIDVELEKTLPVQ